MYQITPYIEQDNVFKNPLDTGAGSVAQTSIKIYYCPSRRQPTLYSNGGRSDYAGNGGRDMAGEGREGVLVRQWKSPGPVKPIDAPVEQRRTITDIADGTSNTVAFSESILGDGAEASATQPGDERTAYKYTGYSGTLPSDAACAGSPQSWNGYNRRGFMWASGEARCVSYNHYLAPNAKSFDCIANDPTATYIAVGYRAARSRHAGGVNTLMGDGSVRFIKNSVSPVALRALITLKGGEVVSADQY
jgi:prepilin-type processing-associated H-X9-DG protein